MRLTLCPFCGKVPEIELDEDCFGKSSDNKLLVCCDSCGATGPTGKTMIEAINKWEQRN